MKTVKFRQLMVTAIDGSQHPEDWAENVGNLLFRMADDVAQYELCIKIYHEPRPDENTGECQGTELTDKDIEILRRQLPLFKYFLQKAVNDALA
jgi:hypothetical protein